MTETPDFKSQAIRTRAVVATFGIFTSSLFLLVVATYPSFFFFNPFENGDPLRSAVLALSTLGWVLIMLGPGFTLTMYAVGFPKFLAALPYVAIFWPASLIINHITLFFQEGEWFTGYLLDYPIFIATDILLPVLLVAVWVEMRPVIAHAKHHGTHTAR